MVLFWTLVWIEYNLFNVDFSRKEDLVRFIVFGICGLPNSPCFLKFF